MITRFQFLALLLVGLAAGSSSAADNITTNLYLAQGTLPGGVPSLDKMAGDWVLMKDVANPPAVHNFNQMLIVDRDLTSFFCNIGQLYKWQHGYPVVKLLIDKKEYSAKETRCYAYRALRRN